MVNWVCSREVNKEWEEVLTITPMRVYGAVLSCVIIEYVVHVTLIVSLH